MSSKYNCSTLDIVFFNSSRYCVFNLPNDTENYPPSRDRRTDPLNGTGVEYYWAIYLSLKQFVSWHLHIAIVGSIILAQLADVVRWPLPSDALELCRRFCAESRLHRRTLALWLLVIVRCCIVGTHNSKMLIGAISQAVRIFGGQMGCLGERACPPNDWCPEPFSGACPVLANG